ncbi:SGNH/GDSL hydrolase family protein [Streptomyces sp. J2-1]|uniref:SGNH/GDSL hydrolase family protein n=1 Tax=Streptomyces corallincola TaxID=2851888 RepID=UPI001C392006|nr:SGNH/GDSL hydrolase family protein [Streptomyces corallincola]MBV2354107.1 SGNH/GDSL hydrolase family protein [Streptomyces corallincola]
MRQSRTAYAVTSLLLAVAFTVAGPLVGEAAPGPAASGYVALGDSYSSGVGAGDYLASSGDCRRSSRAYPALWAAAHAPSSFTFVACNGARTTDVLESQLGALGPRTGLVSVTAGGSDSGFSGVMITCVVAGQRACLSAVDKALAHVDGVLPGDLDRLYAAIDARAPAARVVVLGYPHFYQLPGACSSGLQTPARSAINVAVDRLNLVIAKRAADHGFTFVDVRDSFAGHEICSSTPWLRSVDVLHPTESYHPTAPGQSFGYLPRFSAAI